MTRAAYARSAFAAAILIAVAPAAAQQPDFDSVSVKVLPAGPGVFMLEGAGGNIGLLVGPDGALLIDDQFAPLSEKILAAIATVTDEKVAFLVNTHWHGDHTGGNAPMAAAGAVIVAHDNVRARMKAGLKSATRNTPPAAPEALPVITFSQNATFHWNGQEVRVLHVAPAHTDGDSIVWFPDANVLHMGDNFFRDGYPFIDIASGGTFDGTIAAQEFAASLIPDDATVIPGHGGLSKKSDLEATTEMLREVRARIEALIARGLDEEAVVRAAPLADLDARWGNAFIDGETMTRTAFVSLTSR